MTGAILPHRLRFRLVGRIHEELHSLGRGTLVSTLSPSSSRLGLKPSFVQQLTPRPPRAGDFLEFCSDS